MNEKCMECGIQFDGDVDECARGAICPACLDLLRAERQAMTTQPEPDQPDGEKQWPTFYEYHGGGCILREHNCSAHNLATYCDADVAPQVRGLIQRGCSVLLQAGKIVAVDGLPTPSPAVAGETGTPETDAEVQGDPYGRTRDPAYVKASFARTLERQRNAALSRIQTLEGQLAQREDELREIVGHYMACAHGEPESRVFAAIQSIKPLKSRP